MFIDFLVNLIRKIIFYYKLFSFKKKAILSKNIILSRYSYINISDGSKKGDIVIRDNVMMCGKLYSQNGGKIIIGEFSSIRHHSQVWSVNKIVIGSFVIISDHVIITDNNSHPIEPEVRKKMILKGWSSEMWKWKYSKSKPVIIEDNVWIGKDVRILKGVRIGENSIIAMGSVVTKDVPKNCIVAGNPAKVVKKI